MSELNLGMASSIELSDIRKLDILLTQCETSSCENICNDCCARLGSLEDDDDTSSSDRPRTAPASGGDGKSKGGAADGAQPTPNDANDNQRATTSDVINNVPILSYVTEASTPSQPDEAVDDDEAASKLTPLSGGSSTSVNEALLNKRNPLLANTKGYCTKCGGVKLDGAMSKKRYSSLDKEHTNRISSNLLSTSTETDRGGSENALASAGCRKHCSFEDNCDRSVCAEGKLNDSRVALKSPPSSKKSGSHRSDNTSSKSNPMSSKSSQNSLKENRSRKSSLFHGTSDRDSSFRSRFSTQPSTRRYSTKGQLVLSGDEQDAETREILLGKKADSDLHEKLKIPEPVEAVCELCFLCSFMYYRMIKRIL